jgi:ADP-heptose:LPS heptosyltransferase
MKKKDNRFVKTLLFVIEESGFEFKNIEKTIQRLIEERENYIKQLQEMSEEEFMQYISNFAFGVACKEYYISIHKKDIELLRNVKTSIEWLVDTYKKNRELFNSVVREYKGYVKLVKKYIKKLADSTEQKDIKIYV